MPNTYDEIRAPLAQSQITRKKVMIIWVNRSATTYQVRQNADVIGPDFEAPSL